MPNYTSANSNVSKSSKPSGRKATSKTTKNAYNSITSLAQGLNYGKLNLNNIGSNKNSESVMNKERSLKREANSSMSAKQNSTNAGSCMQRENILNTKYTRKVNKPSLRSNIFSSIKGKDSTKLINNSSLYLSEKIKNEKKSFMSKEIGQTNSLKNASNIEVALKSIGTGNTATGGTSTGNHANNLKQIAHGLNATKNSNLLGFLNKKNRRFGSNGSFESGGMNMSFSKRTNSAKRKSDILKSKHHKNRSMEIERPHSGGVNKDHIKKVLNTQDSQNKVNTGPTLSFSVRTRKGKSANSNKINQDSFITQMNYHGKESQHLFGVYDGHGVNGHLVSNYMSSNLPAFFGYHAKSGVSVEEALYLSYQNCLDELIKGPIDITFSGTTAVTGFMKNYELRVANSGDSRCIIGSYKNGNWGIKEITKDHKPCVKSEADRIIDNGGRIQPYYLKDGEPCGPLRVW